MPPQEDAKNEDDDKHDGDDGGHDDDDEEEEEDDVENDDDVDDNEDDDDDDDEEEEEDYDEDYHEDSDSRDVDIPQVYNDVMDTVLEDLASEHSDSQWTAFIRKKYEKLIIYTETIGTGKTMVMWCEKEASRQGVFLMRYLEHCNTKCPAALSEGVFDVKFHRYLYLRESHENDYRKSMGFVARNGCRYSQCGLFSWPSAKCNRSGGGGGGGSLNIVHEKAFRDSCFRELIRSPTCNESFVKWDATHSLTQRTLQKSGTYKSLDQVFTDESVGNILYSYYIPNGIDQKDVYQYMVDNEITNIYTRKKSDGKYSDFAIKHFGFPSDSVHDKKRKRE